METEPIDFEKTASYLLIRVSTAFKTAFEKQMAAVDLHAGQAFVLIELWHEDGLKQVDIASRLNLSAPTVNKIVKGLIDINLVSLERSDGDGRSTRIYLTEKGWKKRADVEGQWHELEAFCLAGVTEGEKWALMELLRKLKNTYHPTGDIDEDD